MELDLEAFLTTLYVMTDDLYQQFVQPHLPPARGPKARLSDSEVLCLALAGQWRQGVPWQSERGLVRYARKHLRRSFRACSARAPSTAACAACGAPLS